jgi:hypothetical protein
MKYIKEYSFVLNESAIKDADVDIVFNLTPELEKIGTPEQYSQYIDTIFPNSKVKGVTYHQTSNKFDSFDITRAKSGGIYFSPYNKPDFKLVNLLFSGKYSSYTKFALLNIEKPFFVSKKNKKYERGVININWLSKKIDISEYDGVIGYSNSIYYKGEFEKGYLDTNIDVKSNAEIVVFSTKQIHVLGSKQDIEGFKEFVKNN